MKNEKDISDERLGALVGFVNHGLWQLTDEGRRDFARNLNLLFCLRCGRKKKAIKSRCYECFFKLP